MAGQKFISTGVDVDTSPQYLKSDMAYLLKGIELGWILTNDGKAQNDLELKPAESNYLYCSVDLPAGKNIVIGYFYYAESNEGYVVVFNSNGNHLIYRIIGTSQTAQVIYKFPVNFPGIVDQPSYYFSEGRIAMKSLCRYLPDGSKELYKELYLVNKKVDNLRIVVEDSVATNFFTTPFFTPKNPCCDYPHQIIKSGVPTPNDQINIVPIPVTADDKNKQNTTLFKMIQFRILDENAWSQRSEHGIISDQYFNSLAGCSRDASTQPHCAWLETKVPCPEIVKRIIEIRTCQLQNNTSGTDGNIYSAWKEAFTIDLYDKSNVNLKWYERTYDTNNKEFEFFDDGKRMRIKFCNNRECKPIALSDIRDQNPAPINSGTVASIGKELMYGDNENDLPAFPKEDIESIKLELVKNASCEVKFSRVKVYAVVHNYDDKVNNPIYSNSDGVIGFGGFGKIFLDDRLYESAVFSPGKGLTEDGGYGQRFPDGVKGFRAILAGTKYSAESTQYLWTPADFTEVGVYAFSNDFRAFMKEILPGEKILVQCFDFGLIPCGKYMFRICSHDDIPGMQLENTSTFYSETQSWNDYKNSFYVDYNRVKEIFIDTTSGADYDSLQDDKVAVIQDLTYPGDNAFAVRGYIFEDELSKQPIELLNVRKSRGSDNVVGLTDHNGFFFWTTQYGEDYRIQLFGRQKCDYGTMIAKTAVKKKKGTTLVPDVYATVMYPNYAKDLCNRYFLTGKISECLTGGGIEGIAVVLGRTKPVFTNSKGEFKITAHYMDGRGSDKIIASVTGGCYIVNCECKPVDIETTVIQPQCNNCNESISSIGQFSLKTIVAKGFPKGSRIQIGMTGYDWLGRRTYIQTSEKLFIDIPSEQEQGDETYPSLKVILPNTFSETICKNFRKIVFSFSKNTNYEDWITWAADQVKFIDNAGNENKNNPSKVQIWYRSLNEYNILRGLNTNTTWSIIDTNNNSRVGDVVEFIKSADGVYFPPNTIGNVQYDKDGTYFVIDYDESLRDLKDGVKFKLKRLYECETAKTFYEYSFPINFCGTGCIPRNDKGEPVKEFILDGFSSYAIPRQIPVVTDVITNVPATDGGTQQQITQTKKIKVYPFTFEHHSPSDTWGDHCNNGGRINFINPYEGKRCDRNQVLLTGSLNQANDGAINYLHYFSLTDEYVIDEQGWGGIIALLVRDDGQLLLVCEQTTFSFRYNDDRATVDENGYIRLPIKSIFSKPERNPSFNFGCQLADVNTIRRNASFVTYLDSQKQAFVIHDFNQAIDVSDGIQSWLIPAIKDVIESNGNKFWHVSFDLRLNRIFLTKFNKLNSTYTNDDIDLSITNPETWGFDFVQKKWRQYHFTPEYFGNMFGDKKDNQFFSFKDALPYAHHNSKDPSDKFLNYFGIQCKPVIGISVNEGGSIEKYFTGTEVYCKEILFIIERIETSMGQKSKLYSGAWVTAAGMSYAAFLCDIENNNIGDNAIDDFLLDGEPLYGKWMKTLYVPKNYNGQFFLLNSIITYFEVRFVNNQ